MTTDAPRNVPVPDALADVRAQIKALEKTEAELKALILANPDIRTGANWIAEVKEINTTYTDLKELRAMHKDLVDEYVFPKTVIRIELSAIDPDTGEIIPARRARQEAS